MSLHGLSTDQEGHQACRPVGAQHIGTALARIVADELGADWDRVSIHHVDTDPKWGYMVTGGSWSVFHSFQQLSQAGAAGRIALLEAGAALLGEAQSDCQIGDGKVSCGDRAISFGEIVQSGGLDRRFSPEELAALPVKTVDDSAARRVQGYLGFEILDDPSETCQGWVAVIAETYYAAIKAADVLKVDYQLSPSVAVSEAMIQAHGEKLVADRSKGSLFVDEGDVDSARASAATLLTARYRTATALHFQLEPLNATVEFKEGIWHVHTGNQWQSLTLPTVAKALGVADDQVILHQYYLGGGFGRRLYGDYAVPAALTAKAIGKPVKMIFTRPDDARFDQPRSPSVQQFEAMLDEAGNLSAIEHGLTAGWPTSAMAPGFMVDSVDQAGKIDLFASSGADHWYSLPNHRVRAVENDLAQQTFLPGWLRSVGPGWVGWGVESFMDEIAHHAGQDPLEFRLKLLDGQGKNAGKAPESVGGAKRLANVLTHLKSQSQWGRALPENEGLGVAVCGGQERTMPTWIACAAHVHVDPASGVVTVKKISLSVDAGTVVHPDGALAQLEGSVLWGVSLALHESTEFSAGQVAATNLHQYSPLRIRDVPELDIQLLPSDQVPVGLGEPGVIVVAPAIGNAIFQAVGVRVRDLPIRPEMIAEQISTGEAV